MNNEIITIEQAAPPAQVRSAGTAYKISIGQHELTLHRDQDFGKIPGTKAPVLYKAGAERIVWCYGVETKYILEHAIEDPENGFFFYRFKCEFWKGQLHITDGYGSSNTREKKTGSASGFDVANTALKIAKKRALVDGAILIGQLSGMFTQDLENEDVLSEGVRAYGTGEGKVTAPQVKMFYTVASRAGLTRQQAKEFLSRHNYKSAKDILQKEFETMLEELRRIGEEDT